MSSSSSNRRLQILSSHLQQSQPLKNKRPGDENATKVETSFFVKGPFTPRTDEQVHNFSLSSSVIEGSAASLQRLTGSFLRIGPNPRYDFTNKPYHVFDGDGMIHSLKFHGGDSLTYCNKFIKTEAYEKDEQRNFSFSIMGEAAAITQTGNLEWTKYTREPMGRANTALVSHNDRLLALFEQDVPYAIDPVSLETIGKVLDFGTAPFTAHPKICATNGDMIYFGYINGRKRGPFCHYGVVDANGKKIRSFPVTVPAPVMMHDIVITATRSIFFDYNNRYHSPTEIMTGKAKSIYSVETNIPARFGILPRYAKSDAEMVWIEVPPAVVFHFLNAWDEGDEVVVWGCASSSIDLDNLGGEESRTSGGTMTYWRLNVVTGTLVKTFVIDNPPSGTNSNETAVDFAQVPASKVGLPIRYGYTAVFCAGFTIDGVAKYDLQTLETTVYRFDSGVFGGESMFIPRGKEGEDDGWLMCFVYGDKRCESALEVIDSKTMTQVARIALPARVPAGFHAAWKPSNH
jgi:carotenoid cleavage dioxygenase-like enzyme